MTKLTSYVAASFVLIGLAGDPLHAASGSSEIEPESGAVRTAQWADEYAPAYSGYGQFGGDGYGQWSPVPNQSFGGGYGGGRISNSYGGYGQSRQGCHHGGCRQGPNYGYGSAGYGGGGYGAGQWSSPAYLSPSYGASRYSPLNGSQCGPAGFSQRYSPALTGYGQQFSPVTNYSLPGYPLQGYSSQSLQNQGFGGPGVSFGQPASPFGQQSSPYSPQINSFGQPLNSYSPSVQPYGQSGSDFYQQSPNSLQQQSSPFYP